MGRLLGLSYRLRKPGEDSDAGPGRRRQDHHPLQAQDRRGRLHHKRSMYLSSLQHSTSRQSSTRTSASLSGMSVAMRRTGPYAQGIVFVVDSSDRDRMR
ncbi:unnamed protein product [Urochloa humidicola]